MPEHIIGVSNHAQTRMREYHDAVSHAEWRGLLLQILDRQAVLVETKLPRRINEAWNETYACTMRGKTVLVVWAPLNAIVVTVLPPGASAAGYLRRQMGVQRPGAKRGAEKVVHEERGGWRREWEREQ